MQQNRPYQPVNSIDDGSGAPPAASSNRKGFMDYVYHVFTLFGIPVYVHILLPLFFLLSFVFWARVISDDTEHFWYYVALIVLYNLVLWWTVLVHEWGHCLAGYIVGGSSEKIILWPLGTYIQYIL